MHDTNQMHCKNQNLSDFNYQMFPFCLVYSFVPPVIQHCKQRIVQKNAFAINLIITMHQLGSLKVARVTLNFFCTHQHFSPLSSPDTTIINNWCTINNNYMTTVFLLYIFTSVNNTCSTSAPHPFPPSPAIQ